MMNTRRNWPWVRMWRGAGGDSAAKYPVSRLVPTFWRDSAIDYPPMLHVLGGRNRWGYWLVLFQTVCMLPLQNRSSLGQDTLAAHVTSEPLCTASGQKAESNSPAKSNVPGGVVRASKGGVRASKEGARVSKRSVRGAAFQKYVHQ